MPVTSSLTMNILAEVNWNYQNTGFELSTTKDLGRERILRALAGGTADNQADLLWHDQRTVTLATVTDDIDLAGALTDPFGQTVTFVKIRALLIYNRETTTGENLLIGGAGAANNAWATLFNGDQDAKITLAPTGVLLLTAPVDGYSVTAGSQDILRVVHDGTTTGGDIVYDIVVAGTTA